MRALLFVLLAVAAAAQPLPSSETKTLLRLRRLLFNPSALDALPNASDPCSLPPSPSFTLSCSGGAVTVLSVAGNRNAPLPSSFSSDAVFTTLSRLAGLTSLSLVSLGIAGPLPAKLDRLPQLQLLNLSSNFLSGAIPRELAGIASLRSVVLSRNALSGTVPVFRNLAELDLADNNLTAGALPVAGVGLLKLVLKNNNFKGKIDAAAVAAMAALQELDLSGNQFAGWVPAALFSLPAIRSISLAHNRFTGQLPASAYCSGSLQFVDISDNLLSGRLPACMAANTSALSVVYAGNCLSGVGAAGQHSNGYCNQGALAAVLPPAAAVAGSDGKERIDARLIGGILGAILGAGMLIALVVFVVVRKFKPRNRGATPPAAKKTISIGKATAAVDGNGGRTPADKRHATQAARVAVLEVAPYRVFTIEELEEATDYFSDSRLIKDSPQEKQYRAWLRDGSPAMIRCLKLKEKYQHQSLTQYMETVSKLRHRHLVSIIGHCIVASPENPGVNCAVYLVTECVANGTLRSQLTDWRMREMLKWPQRVAAAVGVARGIQFLHGVAVPGIVANDLDIENVLLDQTLTAKISNFNLPSLPYSKSNKVECPFLGTADHGFGSVRSVEEGERRDIYQFGLILLELITGKPAEANKQLQLFFTQPRRSNAAEDTETLKEIADPSIHGTYAVDSLRTVTELVTSCLSEDPWKRPPIDDVLWHLQYSMQVQDGWASSESLSFSSQL